MKCMVRSCMTYSLLVWAIAGDRVSDTRGIRCPEQPNSSGIRVSDLRSAFLPDRPYGRNSALSDSECQAELQRHFDAVLAILTNRTWTAINDAASRLEAARGADWTAAERASIRSNLLAARRLQVDRLRAYLDRGLFPQNEGYADYAVPIFVDKNGTACAVGHLMQMAGWTEEVEQIRATNNLVYVSEVAGGPLQDWVLTSGLLQEEAALIQPKYSIATPHQLSDLLEPGAEIVSHGLRYSNFEFEFHDYVATDERIWCILGECGPDYDPDQPPPFWRQSRGANRPPGTGPIGSFPIPEPGSYIGVGAWHGPLISPFGTYPELYPVGTHWIVFGGAGPDFDYGNFIFGTSEAETAQQVVFRFDVEVMSPDRWIDQASLHQDWYEGGFYSSDGFLALFSSEQDYWLETKLRDDSHGGANLLIDSSNYDVFQNTIVSADLRPTRRLSVETTAWMTGGAFLDSFVVDFNLVPEPSSLALAVCVFVAAGGCMVCTRLRGAVE